MKKKFLYGVAAGIAVTALLLCMPFFHMNLDSGTPRAVPPSPKTAPSLPAAAPDPIEPPVVTDGQYTLALESSVGILTYYNQTDIRWADYLYGGQDPLKKYGCGPTALAMIVTSFTNQTILPSEMADWAAANHYWAPQGGTAHNFIPECAAAFGLQAYSFQNLTVQGVLDELTNGHILVALMGPGHFTGSGHFIIITDYWTGTQVRIADPANLDNTQTPWEIQTILDELSRFANSGGPVWSIRPI